MAPPPPPPPQRSGRPGGAWHPSMTEEIMKTLEGKVALVTGAGSGIGRATALMLAAEGARVAIAGRRKEPLEHVVAEIQRDKGTAVSKTCDLTKPHDGRELGASALQTFGARASWGFVGSHGLLTAGPLSRARSAVPAA